MHISSIVLFGDHFSFCNANELSATIFATSPILLSVIVYGSLTLFTFSIENWRRPKIEVSALMNLLVDTIKYEINELMKNNVRLHVIGRIMELPEKPRVEMMKGIKKTIPTCSCKSN